jgi:hypothetical protein
MKRKKLIQTVLVLLLLCVPVTVFSQNISRSNWVVMYVDSQETLNEPNPAVMVLDGDPATMWHTSWWGPGNLPLPHEIQIDMGGVYNVSAFKYLPRPWGFNHVDAYNVDYGRIKDYQIYVSMDANNWGSPVATGTWPNTSDEQIVYFTAKTGQYLRLRALSEVNGNPWTSAAEINAIGSATSSSSYAVAGQVNGGNGNISCTSPVAAGGSSTCTITPNSGYTLTALTDNWSNVIGAASGSGPYTYTVNNVNINHVVVAAFGATSGNVIPKNGWRLVSVDSQETLHAYDIGWNAFDDNYVSSIWHTQWYPYTQSLPHTIIIDMGATYYVNGFRYYPYQGMYSVNTTTRVGQYDFYVSADGSNWGSAVASGEFANSAAEKEVAFGEKAGRYIKFVAKSNPAGFQFIAVAELTALRSSSAPPPPTTNQAPDSVISSPAANVSINVGETVTFGGSGTDPDNNLPLTYLWNFGAGSGLSNSTAQNPGVLQFNNPGVYTVTFTVTDSQGLSDPTPATRVITVTSGSSSPLISKTGWSVYYVDSQETGRSGYLATNAIDGNSTTMWHTQWSGTPIPLPHEIQINLGAVYKIDSFRYLPRQDGGINGRIGQYEFYVSTDGSTWGSPVATGTFANSADEKYVPFAQKSGQYVRLRALTEANGNAYWTALAELNLTGSYESAGSGGGGGGGGGGTSSDIAKSAWRVVYVDSQAGDPWNATAAIDGGNSTFWHTAWRPAIDPLPHEVQIDLGSVYSIDSFRYLPRQDGGTNGRVGQYEFYVSTDGINWGTAVAAGTFANSSVEKTVAFTAKNGQYIRFRALTEVNGTSYASMAELSLTGTLVSGGSGVVSKAGWQVTYVDSQATGYPASNSIDGSSTTMWHTAWSPTNVPLPHEIQIDMGATHALAGFKYLPRQDGGSNGRVANYEFYVSADGVNWGTAVATGTFANTAVEKSVTFSSTSGRYIRFRALSEVNGNAWTSMAELNVIGN